MRLSTLPLVISRLLCLSSIALANPIFIDDALSSSQSLATRQQPPHTAIPNGQVFYDTTGNPIQSFGGGFLQVNGVYYWVGQDFTVLIDPNSASKANLYKSTDLMNWEKVGSVLTASTPDVNGNTLLEACKIERPKILFNAATKKYVLWAHWELNSDYSASEIITATADNVEGPYVITAAGHRRPGVGNTSPDAMGDRLGEPVTDYSAAARQSSNKNHAYFPAQANYPPKPVQYNAVDPANPDALSYVDATTYGQVPLGRVVFNFTLKAIVARQTAWDRTAYDKYNPDFTVTAANYIVRYPTRQTSSVVAHTFAVGQSGNNSTALVAPVVQPGLDQSSDPSAVLVNAGDAAFITIATNNASIYYTTDGSDPTTSSKVYLSGTRIVFNGTAGTSITVKSVGVLAGRSSSVTTQVYKIASNKSQVPIFRPIINYPSGTYPLNSTAFVLGGMRIYSPSYGTLSYFTTDGLDPQPRRRGYNIGYRSRDFTLYSDPKNDIAYLVSASDSVFFRMWQLDANYTDVVAEKEYDVFVNIAREAPVMIRNGGTNGTYLYMITSSQTGYYPNQSQYKRTTDPTQGFNAPRDPITGYRDGRSSWGNLAPIGDPSTYYSQPVYVFDIGTKQKPVYIYNGDRYAVNSLYNSSYVFIALNIDDNAKSLTGDNTTGLMQLSFNPTLQVDLKGNQIVSDNSTLLSLKKPVNASQSVALTPDQVSAGTYNFSASVANDGVDFDIGNSTIQQYYQPTAVPYYWGVDLQKSYDLAWVGLSFRSVSGNDSVSRYTISGSTDGATWTQLVNNTANAFSGFDSHQLTGSYRYLRVNVQSIYDLVHSQDASSQKGVYEISVYGKDGAGTPSSMSASATTLVTSTATTSASA